MGGVILAAAVCWLIFCPLTAPLDERPRNVSSQSMQDGSTSSSEEGSTNDKPEVRRSRQERDTHSLISQMAHPSASSESLSDARLVSTSAASTARTVESQTAGGTSLFDAMPDRGASRFPSTITPLTLDDQYGPPTVPFAVSDATYGRGSDTELAGLIRRYLSARAQAASPPGASVTGSSGSGAGAQAAPAVSTARLTASAPGVSQIYDFPGTVLSPSPSYNLAQAAPSSVQTYIAPQTATVTRYVVQPPNADSVSVASVTLTPLQNNVLSPVTTTVTYTVQPSAVQAPTQTYSVPQAAAVPVQTYLSPVPASAPAQALSYSATPSQSPAPVASAPATLLQPQQAPPTYGVVQQPGFAAPSAVGPLLLQSPAVGVPQSYRPAAQGALFTPQLAYITPYGVRPPTSQDDRDRDRDSDGGLVISLGEASIQLGGGSGTSITLGGRGRSGGARDSAASDTGNSITIIAGGSGARDPPAPVGPPAPVRGYSAPRDPPSAYSPPRDPVRDPPSAYSPPRNPARDPPSSYSPPRDPPSSYSPPRDPQRDLPASYSPPKNPARDPPSSYSPPRDPPSSYSPPRDPPSSYSPPRDPPSSYGGGRSADATSWRPLSDSRPTQTATFRDGAADDADTYTSYEGQTRTFPPSDSSMSRTGFRDTAAARAPPAPPAPAPPPRTYGAPARDPPSPMYGAPPARDPPAPPPRTYGAPPRDPPSTYGAPPARDPPAPAPMYAAPPARDPPSSTYGAPAMDAVPATPVQLLQVQAVPVAVFNPRPRPRPPPHKKHHHRKRPRPPKGRLVKDTIIREVSRPVTRQRTPPVRGPRPAFAPQLFLATVPQTTQALTLATPVQNPPANPSMGHGSARDPPSAPPSNSYGVPQRSPAARAAPPVGVVSDTLVREVLYDQFQTDYAKLFYKGALLIGALALLPAAAAAGPLAAAAAGRRRRSLFDGQPSAGAELPSELRQQLGAALPELAQLDTSECVQRELCYALRQVEVSPYRDSFLLFYAVLSPDVAKNPWMRQALTAARKQTCADFYCQLNITPTAEPAVVTAMAGATPVNATAHYSTAANATAVGAELNAGTSGDLKT